MRSKKEDLPVFLQEEGAFSRDVEWGDMNVSYEAFPRGMDAAPLFRGLPDDRCQCHHWGYLMKGQLRISYRDHEEVINGGDLYYIAPGHIPAVVEDCELVEFTPKGEYQKTLEVLRRNMEALKHAA